MSEIEVCFCFTKAMSDTTPKVIFTSKCGWNLICWYPTSFIDA